MARAAFAARDNRNPGGSGYILEEYALPASVMREQFEEMYRGRRNASPGKRLAMSMIWEALTDLEKHRFATSRRNQRKFWESYDWVATDNPDSDWPFTFHNICERLDLVPSAVRKNLLCFDGPSTESSKAKAA